MNSTSSSFIVPLTVVIWIGWISGSILLPPDSGECLFMVLRNMEIQYIKSVFPFLKKPCFLSSLFQSLYLCCTWPAFWISIQIGLSPRKVLSGKTPWKSFLNASPAFMTVGRKLFTQDIFMFPVLSSVFLEYFSCTSFCFSILRVCFTHFIEKLNRSLSNEIVSPEN